MDFPTLCSQYLARINKSRTARLSPAEGLPPRRYPALLEMQYGTNHLLKMGAQDFFLGVLRSFSMSKKERAEMEAAARYFAVASKRFTLPEQGWEKKYDEHWAKVEQMFVTACKIVSRGEVCGDDQFCQAGCFRIMNMGGFDAQKMALVKKVVDRAADILAESGFEHLCYGDVYVTKTVMRSSRVLAFYMIADDRMYVRANLKGEEGAAVWTILHEIAHRLDHKFMGADGRIEHRSLYRRYKSEHQQSGHGEVEGGNPPEIGDTFVYKNEEFRVVRITGGKVYLRGAEPETYNATLAMPVEAWMLRHGGKRKAAEIFPTPYSMTSDGEFFAEMFALYLLGKLNDKQRSDFRPIMQRWSKKPTALVRGRAGRRR